MYNSRVNPNINYGLGDDVQMQGHPLQQLDHSGMGHQYLGGAVHVHEKPTEMIVTTEEK